MEKITFANIDRLAAEARKLKAEGKLVSKNVSPESI